MQPTLIQTTVPQSIQKLWYWLIFEPILLQNFTNKLNAAEVFKWFLKSFASLLFIYFILMILRLLIVFWIVNANLPNIAPHLFHSSVLAFWHTGSGTQEKVLFLFVNHLDYSLVMTVIVSLVGGVIAFRSAQHVPEGVTAGFLLGLVSSLVIALVSCLTFGILGGFAYAVTYGLMIGAALGSVAGSASILSTPSERLNGLFIGGILSIMGSLAVVKLDIMGGELQGLADGLGFGGGILAGWIMLYFGLLFYPFHWVNSFFCNRLDCNPYLYDGKIWLPIPGLNKRLIEQAKLEPEFICLFIQFLAKYRPLQQSLVEALSHVSVQDNLKSL